MSSFRYILVTLLKILVIQSFPEKTKLPWQKEII